MRERIERWRPVVGYEDEYEVSDLGNIRGLNRSVWTESGIERRILGVALKPYVNSAGYLVVSIGDVPQRIHRLVAFAFIGPPPTSSHEVAHADGVRTNNVLSNLRWATRTENMADAIAHGTTMRGERAPRSKLSEADVLRIREMRAKGMLLREIAAEFGVARQTVGNVIDGSRWSHVS